VRNPQNGIQDKLGALDKVISVKAEKDNEFLIECEMNAHAQDQVARLALENSWGIEELRLISMTLEEIFLHLTMEEDEPDDVKNGVGV